MKTALYILVLLVVLVCVLFAWLSATAKDPDVTLVDGRLRPCPATPNCVSSETTGDAFIEPLRPADGGDLNELWRTAVASLTEMGGNIEQQDDGFIWTTFRSRLFRFTDDVELRKDDQAGVIQIRSGSRSGKSDFGVNRKRLDTLRETLAGSQ